MPFFSIIIPRCLDSVVNQSFKDIEIIIVDDCGNDDSINIAKEYANKDSRIRILKNSENRGVFCSRIEGERVMNGRYAMHIDPDDSIHLDACQILHQNIQKDRINRGGGYIDICCFDVEFPTKPSRPIFSKNPPTSFDTNQNAWLKITKMASWAVWNKVYKREIALKSIALLDSLGEIPHISMAEDGLKTFIISIFIQNGIYVDSKLYHYSCDNDNSITRTKDLQRKQKSYKDLCFILDFIDKIPDIHKDLKSNKLKMKRTVFVEAMRFKASLDGRCNFFTTPLIHLKSMKYDKSYKPLARIILYFLTLGKMRF